MFGLFEIFFNNYFKLVIVHGFFLFTMPRPRRSKISSQTRNAIRMRNIMNQSTEEQRQQAREVARLRIRNLRDDASSVDLNRAAFQYDCTIDYSSHPSLRVWSNGCCLRALSRIKICRRNAWIVNY